MRRIDRVTALFLTVFFAAAFTSLSVLTDFEPRSWPIKIAVCGWVTVWLFLLCVMIFCFLEPLNDLKQTLKLDAAEYEGQRVFFPIHNAPCTVEQKLEHLSHFFQEEGFTVQKNKNIGETCCQLRALRIIQNCGTAPVGVLFDFIDTPDLSFPLIDRYLEELSKKAKSLLAVKHRVFCPCFLASKPDLEFLKLFWMVDTYPWGSICPSYTTVETARCFLPAAERYRKKMPLQSR